LRRLFFTLIFLAVLYSGSEFGVKTYVEAQMEDEVRAEAPTATGIDASVSLPIVLPVIRESAIKTVRLRVAGANVGPFVADKISATFHEVLVDRSVLIQKREVQVNAIGRFDGTIELSEAEVSKILPQGFSFKFEQDAVVLQAPGGIRVRGRLEQSKRGFTFNPGSSSLPGGMKVPTWSFGDVPFGSCVDRIEIQPGQAIISCHVDHPPAKFPPS
jgi:hypothetical protein